MKNCLLRIEGSRSKSSQNLSVHSIGKDESNEKVSCFDVLLKENSPDRPEKADHHPKIAKIFKEYNEVFPKALSKGLPPDRAENSDIKPLSEAKRKNEPMYRMSHREQEKITMQNRRTYRI